jgi:hypothetical protein
VATKCSFAWLQHEATVRNGKAKTRKWTFYFAVIGVFKPLVQKLTPLIF